MTTETEEPQADEPASALPAVPAASAPEAVELEPGAGEVVPKNPLVERFLVPLLLPLIVVALILFFTLNMSRFFIATKGTGAVIAGTVITLAILIGAAVISAAIPRIKGSTIALAIAGFLGVVLLFGWLAVGSAEEETEAAANLGPPVFKIEVESGNLYFKPSDFTVPGAAGSVVEVDIVNTGGDHTFVFDDPQVATEPGTISMTGPGDFVGKFSVPGPGEFTYFCSIPGHREAGMEGVITADEGVEGTPIEEGAAPAEG